MQQLTQHTHSSPPLSSPARRGTAWPMLTLWAAFFCVGAVAGGCGVDPVLELAGTSNPVSKDTLTPPDPAACYSETQGGSTSCKDEATWSAYAAMSCAGKGGMLKSIKFATTCGPGLYRQATYECCTGAPPPPRMCMWAPATGVGTCLPADAWKKEGSAFCNARGLDLNDLKLDRPCGTGYGTAQFECCTKSPPPPPPPPPPVCSRESLASMSCVDDGTWKTKIEATCKSKMQTVGTVVFGRACMGGHLDVQFTCCGPTPPPPPPPLCTNEGMASRTCLDDATWKRQADAACNAKKLTLTGLTYGKACMGGHEDIQFTCCPVTPPPPPPVCSRESLASMSCVDDGTWKAKIEATCKGKMQTVGTVVFGRACMGGHMDVQFTCCGPTVPPPPMCTTETVASMSCIDDGTWKTRADAVCASKKLTLARLAFGRVCMGGHQDITFTCCPGTPPPPPMCSLEKSPSGGVCLTPDQWKVHGERVCTSKMQSLVGLSLSGACMGGFSAATFECCPGTPPPPPPVCTSGVLGDGRSCVAEATLKSHAEDTCKMGGTRLTAFAPYDVCGPMGGYLHAKYECCK